MVRGCLKEMRWGVRPANEAQVVYDVIVRFVAFAKRMFRFRSGEIKHQMLQSASSTLFVSANVEWQTLLPLGVLGW